MKRVRHDYSRFADRNEDARRTKRVEVSLLCELRQGANGWGLVQLSDLSPLGFRIAWLPNFDPAKLLTVRIKGLEPLDARIRWHDGTTLGCQFVKPLHVAVFEHILRETGHS